MKKQIVFAAPFLAAVTFVCNPMFADDKAIDTSGGNQSRAAEVRDPSGAPASVGQAANDQSTDPVRVVGDQAGEARVAGAREAGSKDQKCAMKIADVNNFEIQAGQLAQQKAQSNEIKQFAKMMVDDHTQAQQQLQQIAQQKGWQFSQELMPVHREMLSELNKLDGQEFERAYLYGQVAGHTKTALKLRDDKTELQDPQLKQYAATLLPKVQAHLRHGQQLANADEAITAGARISGDQDARQSDTTTTDRAPTDKVPSSGGGRPERGAAPAPGAGDASK